MRAISHIDLPNTVLKTVGTIPLWSLFPIETGFNCDRNTFIHYDGSLVCFCKLKNIDTIDFLEMIAALESSSSLQIYRYHTPDSESFYLSIRKEIDYAHIIPTSIFLGFSRNPIKKQLNSIYEKTSTAFFFLHKILNKLSHEKIDFCESELAHILLNFTLFPHIIPTLFYDSTCSFS